MMVKTSLNEGYYSFLELKTRPSHPVVTGIAMVTRGPLTCGLEKARSLFFNGAAGLFPGKR